MPDRERVDADMGGDETLDALFRSAAHVSGVDRTRLGLRLKQGDLLREGRLRIEQRIGEGGMGVVYQAFDEERKGSVALKTLSLLDAESVYRLKSEFRSLADVSHENLCRLYELFSSDGDWYFTMELVRGVCFDGWVRPHGVLDEGRLRAALAGLFAGVAAIHAAGKLHRDLKPSNVLVTEEGRVVVLDFGLVSDSEPGGETLDDGCVRGTPIYMAPEQAAGLPATSASDFYAIGVMLFEALTGELPFRGRTGEQLALKQVQAAPHVRSIAADAPSDLAELCDRLLARDPAARPDAAELQRAIVPFASASTSASFPLLHGASGGRRPSGHPPSGSLTLELEGRESELQALRAAFATTEAGNAVVMLISGESGIGKSALVSAFLEEVSKAGRAVVLSGRCYERENVPFKGFDALVDDLTRYLRRLSREEALAVLPRDTFALARVFPVLARVPLVVEAPVKQVDDPLELRRRAFAAFGELIGRIRDRRPLCVFMDDLQWLDPDSVLFMRALLVDRNPAPLLLLLSYRSEEAEHNERLSAVIDVARANASLSVERLPIGPLAEAAAQTLALESLPLELEDRIGLAGNIAREAGGSPSFVVELARFAVRTGGSVTGRSLANVLCALFAALREPARRLLEVSALSGQPLPVEVLLAASRSTHDALDELYARHLVRLEHTAHGRRLACYQHRITEIVLSQLSDAVRCELSRALAEALLAGHEPADPELVSALSAASGQKVQAAHYAALAAARAEQGMAFDRAAELYQKALVLGPADAPERHACAVALADALSNAGRGKEAADAYLVAASEVTGMELVELRRQAVDELLGAGYAKEGEALARQVCRDVGIALPSSQAEALLSYGIMEARLRFMSLENRCAQPSQLTADERLRLDVARTATRLAAGDAVLGLWTVAKHLLLSLASREPVNLAYALATEAYSVTVLSPKSEARIAELFALAEQYVTGAGRPDIEGYIAVLQGIGCSFGRAITAEASRALLLRGIELIRGCRGVRYELDIGNLYLMRAMSHDLAGDARRSAALVEEAFSLGRVWAATHMVNMSAPARLAVGDAASVMRHLEKVKLIWTPLASMQWADLSYLVATAHIASYQGDPETMLAAFENAWPWYERSPLHYSASSRALMHGYRGVASLWLARTSGTSAPRRRRLLGVARSDFRVVEKIASLSEVDLALAFRTGLALATGDRAAAVRALRAYLKAEPSIPAVVRLDLMGARLRLGQLVGGEEGLALRTAADAELRALGVVDPERTISMILPGSFVD